ncbi:MAG TPA: hypothetical protein PKB13_01045 [Clostridia bacterium]|nr:hypothetical protein [Clostridia bacterium]
MIWRDEFIPFFVSMIRQGKFALANVPEEGRAKVEAALAEQTA